MAMYYYARKLQKGASSSTSSSSSVARRSKTPPTVNVNGSIPSCCTPQHNGPIGIGIPPPPPCVMKGVNGGLVSGGSYTVKPHHHHRQQSPHQAQHHHYHQISHPHYHPPAPPQQNQHSPHQCRFKHSNHSPHHDHHNFSHHQQVQQQQHYRYHLQNGSCCCGGFGGGATTVAVTTSSTNTPTLNHHHYRQPVEEPDEVLYDDYDDDHDEDDYDNDDCEVPVVCKVHNKTESPSPSYCDKRQGASAAPRSSCGGVTGGSVCTSVSSPNLSSEENKDLIFNGPHLSSGTWEALVQYLLPTEAHFPDHDYIFAFLLSARLYVQPHELLSRIFQLVIDVSGSTKNSPRSSPQPTCNSAHGGPSPINATDFSEIAEDDIDLPLNVIPLLVKLVRPWTELYPYDFRDDRMMAHVRILAHKCVASDAEVREQVSQLLADLLSRLAALDKYEEFLHRVTIEASIGEPIAAPSVVTICPNPATMAEQLTLVELQRFSFIGPEEFVQTLGKEDLKTGVRHCDCVNRKTKNLEAYVRWFQRLTYYVASEICKMSKKKSRCRVCEYWVQVAKECLNIRNFNSLMAILAGLSILPVARLKKTWSKSLYAALAEVEKAVDPQHNYAPYRKLYKAAVWHCTGKTSDSQTYKILVPYFSLLMKDIYYLDNVHPSRLPNGHINFEKCREIAKLVTEITYWQKVKCDFVQIQSIFNSVQASPIFNEQALTGKNVSSSKNAMDKSSWNLSGNHF